MVDAVAAAGARRGAGRQREVLVFGHIGAMLERSGTAKSLRFPRKRSLATTMQGRLCLSISSRSPSTMLKKSWEMDTIFIGYAPFIRSGARIAAGPYRWAIFYALRHPVAHGG